MLADLFSFLFGLFVLISTVFGFVYNTLKASQCFQASEDWNEGSTIQSTSFGAWYAMYSTVGIFLGAIPWLMVADLHNPRHLWFIAAIVMAMLVIPGVLGDRSNFRRAMLAFSEVLTRKTEG